MSEEKIEGKLIAKCQAIKIKSWQDSKGVWVTFLLKDKVCLPPEEFYDDLRDLQVGQDSGNCNLYVSIEEMEP